MRLIYFDEAGIGSIEDEPITTVAAVVVHGDREMPLVNSKVRSIRAKFSIKSQHDFEFKADKMFSHIRKFGVESRYYKITMAFLQMMRDLNLPIYAIAIDRMSFKKCHPSVKPECLAFGSVAGTIAQWLHSLEPPEGGLCLADKSRSEQDWESAMESIRHNGLVLNDPNNGSTINITALDYFSDTMLFQESKKSLGIQMADYANFFYKMHMMKQKDAAFPYQIIEPLFKMGGICYARQKDSR
jgi:hypothetical protein